ncbi:class I SAM-dependent methyltransferase [Vibrio sp. ZSDZ65]|uniref:Class I SAM-dependent methyltransferase n=1 Tax=Vibrio qingdaonensis TaxID=2829491 RepID=A0A9X3CR55_9VIBR|nr:class I SAM-dependent methyltransferase [Vibrio qingdaonensis]MCW8348137.1 class I SAM-dependent methyltransferase [Vibrio qingdaonensis]
MEYTGERYVPNVVKSMVITLEHWHRYIMASNFIKGKKVLDVACGTGYGSNMLSRTADSVVGGDISRDNINYCNEIYDAENLTFQVEDIENLSFLDNSFDVVTCFETIEHVDEETQKRALSEIKRVLKPKGVLLITTPNVDSKHYAGVDNEFHIKELDKLEFSDILSKNFKNVRFSSQFQSSCSFILPLNASEKKHTRFLKKNKAPTFAKINLECEVNSVTVYEGKFFIAGCSDGEVSLLESSTLLDDDNSLYKEYDSHIASLQETLGMKDEIIAESNLYIHSLKQAIEEKDEIIRKLIKELKDSD